MSNFVDSRKYTPRLRAFAFQFENEPQHEPYMVNHGDGSMSLVDPLTDERSNFDYKMFSIENLVSNGVDLQLVNPLSDSPLKTASMLEVILPNIEQHASLLDASASISSDVKPSNTDSK